MSCGEGVIEGRKVFGNITKYIKMGASSNFGNMFSVLGASIFLPFLPMAPIQVLTNNLLYDFSQTAIPTDNVDEEYLLTPRRWDIGNIMRFMIFIGPISSIFDYVTYFTMIYVFDAWNDPALFQTGWFVESLLTQTLIIHIIRTAKIPVHRKPREHGVDFDIDPDLRGGCCVAIHVDRCLARIRAAAAALLARRDRNHRLLCRPDAYRKDMVRAAVGNVMRRAMRLRPAVCRPRTTGICQRSFRGAAAQRRRAPESMNTECGVWIPGCRAALGPRNDMQD